jgi:SAM-dependent methyltransferase
MANFDRIARLYRWMEYATLGPALERCRNHYLVRAAERSHALILGDGDGRFTARLLAANPALHADAVDTSAVMLHLLRTRSGAANRLRTHHADALTITLPPGADLVVAHFFFDCFPQPELDTLIARIASGVEPGALWLVSEFRIPTGPLHWPARTYIRMLYLAFDILTGLRATRLPDFAAALHRAGLAPIAIHRSLFGLITTELWQRTH